VKRSAALTPLSHDHQHALDAAHWLRRTGDDAAVARFREFFASEGSRHFEIEERVILPALPADDAEWAPGVARVREDHAAIRAAADGDLPQPAAQALGERLHDHVRFEERTLFPLLERRLAPDELERLGAAIAAAEQG
jgi:Hemerythrin HHE cation binding domain